MLLQNSIITEIDELSSADFTKYRMNKSKLEQTVLIIKNHVLHEGMYFPKSDNIYLYLEE